MATKWSQMALRIPTPSLGSQGAALGNITARLWKKLNILTASILSFILKLWDCFKKCKIGGGLIGKNKVCLEGRTVNQEQSYRKVSAVFSSKLTGIFGLGQTDQHSTLLPSFQPQNIFLNFKSLKKKCYICFMSFYYWVWWKPNARLCLLWPQKKLGQWKKLRFCFFFSTHLLRLSKYITQKISSFEKNFTLNTYGFDD